MKNFFCVLILIFISCKQNKKLSEAHQIQESISKTTNVKKEIETQSQVIGKKNQCINSSNSNFKYPIQGGSQLMTLGMEEKIELRELECEITDKLKSSMCLIDDISYYFLATINEANAIIIYDECGDKLNRPCQFTFHGSDIMIVLNV